MKRKINYLVSGFTLALCITSFTGTSATALPTTPENSSEATKSSAEKNQKKDKDYNSTILLNSSEGQEVINVDTFGTTVSEAISEHGDELSNYKTKDSETIDESESLDNGENLSLFKSEISGNSKNIVIEKTVVKKKTDDLYVGEKEIKDEGKDGKALKTTVITKNLASDKKINEDAKTVQTPEETVEEKLTVLEPPKPKVILIGTKERPEEVTPDESESSNSDDNSDNDSINSENNENSSNSSTEDSNNSSSPQSASRGTSSSDNSSRSDEGSNSGSGSSRSDVVQLAKEQLGKPYVWGATGPNSFDCSGLVYYIYHTKKGMNIPRTSTAQGMASTPVSFSNIRPGDIVWRTGHIGIYVGGGQVIHAPRAGKPVTSLSLSYFMNNGFKAGRF